MKTGVIMNIIGIIAEYNPFHQGHQYQFDYVRKNLNADYIIIAMSGDFVQRGIPALLPKHVRAEMALRCGADLVLELPVSFSTASAETFAMGGVSLFHGLGVTDCLCFGSENGEVTELQALAEVLVHEPEDYKVQLKKLLKTGLSFPAARSLALKEYFDDVGSILSTPNNILGIEYCKALLRLKSNIQPVTLKRIGANYHQLAIRKNQPPSASAIRHFFKAGNSPEDLDGLLPEICLSIMENARLNNEFVCENDFDLLLSYRLLNETTESLLQYADMSADLAARIISRRNQFQSFMQFTDILKTKELTRARIQRALLHTVLGTREIPQILPYGRILGFRREAAPLLKRIKAETSIPVIVKAADAASLLSESALPVWRENVLASNIYESVLSNKTKKAFVHEYKKQLVII